MLVGARHRMYKVKRVSNCICLHGALNLKNQRGSLSKRQFAQRNKRDLCKKIVVSQGIYSTCTGTVGTVYNTYIIWTRKSTSCHTCVQEYMSYMYYCTCTVHV